MKKTLAAAAVLAALALTGCSTGNNQSTEAAPSATAASSAPATVAPATFSAADIAKAKQEAIDSGRPENAWDKNCIAWEWPEADSKGQEWANKLGKKWLDNRGADCPDAIVYPFYDITSFESGKDGSLLVSYSGNPEWGGDGEIVAEEILNDLSDLESAPSSVVVRYEKNGLEMVAKAK
ncbi:hypothetical protein [Glutamicibacter creatinolyticus]|nr:hypothetical protein [Glutamicibacter creatinolyticus]